jgi:hypothetical protein
VTPAAAETDLDAIERDLHAKIARLRGDVARLSFDAFQDPAVKAELGAVESELGGAERELQRIDFARAEHERREAEAREQEITTRQAQALQLARKIGARRQAAAVAVDKAAAAFAKAIGEHVEVARAQQEALREAGRPSEAHAVRPTAFRLEAALAYALREASWGGALRELGLLSRLPAIPPRHQLQLAESDLRMCDAD